MSQFVFLVQKILRGWGGMRPSQLVSSMTMGMGKKQPVGDSSTSPSTSTNAKPDLPRKISTMRPPLFPPKHPFEAAPAESNRLATRDPPSKLAGLPFDTYKRTKSKTVPVSDAGRSMVPVSPVDKPVDKGKAPVKQTQGMGKPSTSIRILILVKHLKPCAIHLRRKRSLLMQKS